MLSGASVGIDATSDLKAFCLFVGYPRSGHSLVGSLLDAHPDVAVSHQADAMRLVSEGMGREELIETLLADTQTRAAGGRRQSGYSYAVEGQWQGRVRVLRVIGDCRGGKTTRRVSTDEDAPKAFASAVGLPLRFVHVLRNPFDNIATMSRQREHTLDSAIADYASLADGVAGFLERGGEEVLTVHHKQLIEDPRAELSTLCKFLGVEAGDDYLDACAAIVFPAPRRTRTTIEWTPAAIRRVEDLVERHPHLEGYSFDS